MNKKAQLDIELDMETVFAIILAVIGGIFALFIMKSVHLNFFWKLMTFVCTTVVCFFMVKFIASRG